MIEKTNEQNKIKKIIAIISGKGGVGKSSVTSLLSAILKTNGYKVGILDADLGGSSIPKIFGVNSKKAVVEDQKILPVTTATGIKVMSLNFLMEKEDAPVIWRGPLISKTIKQFYTDVIWGDLDYLLIDLPPGTSDASLTIMQSLPIDGIVVVSSPQDLVKFIVKKSVNMAVKLNVPILGVVENMSYYECPECRKKIYIFGKGKASEAAKEMDVELLTQIPIDPLFAKMCDEGKIETYVQINNLRINSLADKLLGKL
jgi:Mrp family chromosome partitioning ATPase